MIVEEWDYIAKETKTCKYYGGCEMKSEGCKWLFGLERDPEWKFGKLGSMKDPTLITQH